MRREWANATPQAREALRNVDIDRLSRGSRSLSQPASAVALRAASTGESAIGDPDEGIWSDFTRNVGEFASGLPRLPQAILGEFRDIPSAVGQIPEALKKGDNPIEDIGNLADLPGLRLLPGSFIASQFGTDKPGVQGLVDNPLFTGLDALPFVSKAAGMTKTVKAAERLAGAGERVGKFGTLTRYARPGGPVLDDAGKMVPNRIGRGLERAGEKFAGTRTGVAFNSTFGRDAGDVAQRNARIGAEVSNLKIASAENAEVLRVRELALEGEKIGADLGPVRAAELKRLYERDAADPSLAPSALTPAEARYVEIMGESDRTLAPQNVADGKLVEVDIDLPSGQTVRELYTPDVAGRIARARKYRDRATTLYGTIDGQATRAPLDHAGFIDRMAETVDVPLPAAQRGWLIRGELNRLELAGYDTRPLRNALTAAKKSAASLEAFHRSLTTLDPARLGPARPFVLPGRAALMTLGQVDPLVKSYIALSDAGSWKKAAQVARQVGGRATPPPGFDWDSIARHARANALVDRSIAKGPQITASQVAKWDKKVESTIANSLPARWAPRIAEDIRSKLSAEVVDLQARGLLSADDAAKASELIALDVLDAPSLPPALKSVVREVGRDVRKTWVELADQGVSPGFVHRTSRSWMGRAPTIMAVNPSLSQVQKRVLDFGSTVDDAMVALDAQAVEILSRRGSEQFQDFLIDSFSRDIADIKSGLTVFARDAAARNPSLSPAAHLDNLVRRNWAPIQTYRGEFWVPRDIAKVAEGFGPKHINSAFLATYDKAMSAFRTSLLPLSPRWHVYNIVGGAIMATAEHGPGVWRHWRQAWDIARHGGLDDVAGLPAMGKSTRALREAHQWGRKIDLTTDVGKASALWDFAMGRKLRQWWDESLPAAQAKRGVTATLDRSYAINEMFDDFYRSMSYLYGERKGLAKYGTKEAAEEAGVAAARKVLASWDRLTPAERSIIRSVFPFYSWSKLLLGYVTRFPFDHPLRTAVTASLVRAELEDFGTGLPQSMFSLIDITGPAKFLGADVADGEKVMLNMDGMNPFRDVGSWASLVGFVGSGLTGNIDPTADIGAVTSQSSPAIQYLLGAMGVDPAEGVADPYADVTLDPTTGQLKSVNSFNPLSAIPQSIIPQSKVVFDALGRNYDYQRLLASNPDAARRRMLSSLGVPATVNPRYITPTEEIVKAEARRYEDVSRTKSRALRSGNLDMLDRYPTVLGATKARLEEAKKKGVLESPDEATIRAALGG